MFIQTEETPNPASLKFLPGRPVLPGGGRDFADAASAQASPLARTLFGLGGVSGVYLGGDFVTVSKAAEEEWTTLKPLVLGALMDHFTSGLPVVDDAAGGTQGAGSNDGGDQGGHASDGAGDPVVGQILTLLDTRIRPAVAQDGGDITFHAYQDGVVFLRMRGACSGCPSSTATLRHGIETMLRHYIPEVRAVQAVI